MTLFSSADADCNNHSYDNEYSATSTNQYPLQKIIFFLFVLQVADEIFVVLANHHLQIDDCNSRRIFPVSKERGGGGEESDNGVQTIVLADGGTLTMYTSINT